MPSHVGVCPCGWLWCCGPGDLVPDAPEPAARCPECGELVAVIARFPETPSPETQ